MTEEENIHWHPGFYGGVELELIEYKAELTFESEHNLSKEPLRMDMLIIKKNADIEIKNQIGAIFRKYNILEYKSPGDGLTIDDYIKTVGYAYIYKGLGKTVNEIPLNELTVSLCREEYPDELIRLIEASGGKVEERFPGIYYVTGLIAIPSQIIVTSRLKGEEHAALKILSRNAKEEDVRSFLEQSKSFKTQGDIENANAVLQVSVTANSRLYSMIRGDDVMCQALMDLMKDEIEEREEKATEAATGMAIRKMMSSLNLTAEEAMDALEIPQDKRQIFVMYLN
ncbi:MAG: hypothetical protein IKO61_10490 [Lachnospiraceae bacterium]|nr:hypothetical protein [Lachnospiraceae bacterium]